MGGAVRPQAARRSYALRRSYAVAVNVSTPKQIPNIVVAVMWLAAEATCVEAVNAVAAMGRSSAAAFVWIPPPTTYIAEDVRILVVSASNAREGSACANKATLFVATIAWIF